MRLFFGKQYEVCGNADPEHMALTNTTDITHNTCKNNPFVSHVILRSPDDDEQRLDDFSQLSIISVCPHANYMA